MPYCSECAAAVPAGVERCPACGSSLAPTPTQAEEPASGPTFDAAELQQELARSLAPQYEILKLLGLGGMGAVFLAREPALKRLVAVKALAPWLAADATSRARFEREATAAAQLSHPNVVRVFSVGETRNEKLPYIVMQYVQGPTLADWMGEREKVSERDARRIVGEVAAALAAAHQREFVHRDVKPSNVLLEQESGRAYVADFGVSAAVSPEAQVERTKLTATGMLLGTPVYMSPEQAASEPVTPKSDVYSLGMLAYELVTGELPFTASSAMGWAAAHLRDTPTPIHGKRPDLSPEILKLIDGCLAKDPAARPTAAEVARGMLPSLETEIDWPPPGTQTLHRSVTLVIRECMVTAVGALLLGLAVANTPTVLRASAQWLTRFEVTRQQLGDEFQLRATAPEAGEVAFFAWQAVLLIGTILFALGAAYTVIHLWRIARAVAGHRKLGWTWDVLVDVAVDPDGRTGRIMAGTREFASLEAARRAGIVRGRRRRAAVVLAGWALPVVSIGLWLLITVGGVGAAPLPRPLVPVPLPIVVGGLTLALLLAGLTYRLRERNLLGPLARRRRFTTDPLDVQRWYESLPADRARPAGDHRASPWRRRIGFAAAGLVTLAAAVAAVEVSVVSLASARFVQRMGPQTAAKLAAIDRLGEADPLGAARQAWQAYLPAVDPLDDSTAVGLLRALATDWQSVEHLPPYPVDGDSLRQVAAATLDGLREGAPLVELVAQIPGGLAEHPRTMALGRLAGASAAALDVAPLDRPYLEYTTLWEVPILRYGAIRDAAAANALAAVAASARGDWDEALRRVGYNLTIGDRLLNGWSLLSNLLGSRLIQTSVLPYLAAFEERRGNSAAADRLRDASNRIDELRIPLPGSAGLMVDPSDPSQLRRVFSNPSLTWGYRFEAVVGAWGGMCANPSELLTGASTERLDAVLSIVDTVEHAGFRARDLALLTHRSFRQPLEGSATLPQWFPILVALKVNLCADQP